MSFSWHKEKDHHGTDLDANMNICILYLDLERNDYDRKTCNTVH